VEIERIGVLTNVVQAAGDSDGTAALASVEIERA
jgi:hypothetical protein